MEQFITHNGKKYRYVRCEEGFRIEYIYQNVDPLKSWDKIAVPAGLSETWGD